jgi:hypothetical protein
MNLGFAKLHTDGRLSGLIVVSQHDFTGVEAVFSFQQHIFIRLQPSPKVRVEESPPHVAQAAFTGSAASKLRNLCT